MDTDDAKRQAWETERQRLQQAVVDAVRALLAHSGGAASFAFPLPEGGIIAAGDVESVKRLIEYC